MKTLFILILISLSTNFANALMVTEEQSASGYKYILGIPDDLSANSRVLLVLHGCAQTMRSVYDLTEIEKYADAEDMIVIVPSQKSFANAAHCWNFYDPENHQANSKSSETKDLVGIIEEVSVRLGVKPFQQYVMGFSSGAAQALNLFACYPDYFQAAAVHSGLTFAAANSSFSGGRLAKRGPTQSVEELNQKYMDCAGSFTKVRRLMVLHGDQDNVVNVANGQMISAQVLGRKLTEEDFIEYAVEEGLYPFKVAKVSTELTDLTYVEVKGMAHKWGGSLDNSRVADEKGPRAIEMILKEFNR